MPYTPYHIGPSGFFGLVFKKYIDVPVFVLANVIVDIEVLAINLLGLRWPIHRYFHTLLIGAALGVVWGLAAYPLRNLLKKIMTIVHIPYQTSFRKMLISGILGVWAHVLIDAIYHYDVRLFWPSRTNPLYRLLTEEQVRNVCIVFFVLFFIEYAFTVRAYVKQNKAKNNKS
ncbi:MAG: metal-dependent hydrolase [Planctomycetota bacterium]|jgi:membrane-bound metal-dependent hydrolase YbcI (DUF457 family)